MKVEYKKIRIGIIEDIITGKKNIFNIFNNKNFNEYELSTSGCTKKLKI